MVCYLGGPISGVNFIGNSPSIIVSGVLVWIEAEVMGLLSWESIDILLEISALAWDDFSIFNMVGVSWMEDPGINLISNCSHVLLLTPVQAVQTCTILGEWKCIIDWWLFIEQSQMYSGITVYLFVIGDGYPVGAGSVVVSPL